MGLLQTINSAKGQIALLIDPEKTNTPLQLRPLIEKSEVAKIDYFFVGGSTVTRNLIETVVDFLKANSSIPVVLFPGASHQISEKADALLFLNLISGRNPDYLIGHQIAAAEEIFSSNLEIISTSYLLVDGGTSSSVAYVSQTTPIPQEQSNIALNTAKAGKLIGHQLVYLDAGSGAKYTVPFEMVKTIDEHIQSPIIVGGGIRDIESIQRMGSAGANVIVIGNKIESDIDFLLDIASYQSKKLASKP